LRRCGRRLTPRYTGNGGLYPVYECTWRKREALASQTCIHVRCDLLDRAVAARVLQVLNPAQIQIALRALAELDQRDQAVDRQWRLKIERADYDAQLAQRRYEEVDPSNRLVAATLERRWNEALTQLEQVRQADDQRRQSRPFSVTPEQKAQIEQLAQDLPRLWHADTTAAKDRKRILRLLVKDITVERATDPARAVLHLRWQGGACEDISVLLPPPISDRLRYAQATIERVRHLALNDRLSDDQIAATLNQQGDLSATGKPFNTSMIKWIRFRYDIPAPKLKHDDEQTVQQVAEAFGVRPTVVYYWIERGVIQARKINRGSLWWITIDEVKKAELIRWVNDSTKLQKQRAAQPERPL
jgi:hypothetical protein